MLDPVALLAEVRNIQADGQRVDQHLRKLASQPAADGSYRRYRTRWTRGEQERAIHRRPYVRRKPVPRRSSMLNSYKHLIDEWLAAAAHTPAVQILARLIKYAPNQFSQKQERTVGPVRQELASAGCPSSHCQHRSGNQSKSGPIGEIAAHTAQIETAAKVQLGA